MSNSMFKSDDVSALDKAVEALESDATNLNQLRTLMVVAFGKVAEKAVHNACKGSGEYESDRTKSVRELYGKYGQRILERGLIRKLDEKSFKRWVDSAMQVAVIVNVMFEGRGLENFEFTALEAIGEKVRRESGTMKYRPAKGFEEHLETVVREILDNTIQATGAAVRRRFDELVPKAPESDAERQVKAEKQARGKFEKAVAALDETGQSVCELLGEDRIAETLAAHPDWVATIVQRLVLKGASATLKAIGKEALKLQDTRPDLLAEADAELDAEVAAAA